MDTPSPLFVAKDLLQRYINIYSYLSLYRAAHFVVLFLNVLNISIIFFSIHRSPIYNYDYNAYAYRFWNSTGRYLSSRNAHLVHQNW
jgi:hypothetical protein